MFGRPIITYQHWGFFYRKRLPPGLKLQALQEFVPLILRTSARAIHQVTWMRIYNMPIWSENSEMPSQAVFNFYPRLFTSRRSGVQPNGGKPAPNIDYNSPHSANPREIQVQPSEQGKQSPAQISPPITNTEPGGLQLEQLSKPELIEVVMRLQAELSRRASSAAFLQTLARYLLAGLIILIPFRYRWVLLPRPMPPLYADYTDFLLYASDVLLILTLAAWLTSLALRPRRTQIGPRLLALPLGGLVVIASLTSLTSLDIPLSIYHSFRLVLLAGLYLYLVNELRGLKELVLPLLISLFIQSTVAVRSNPGPALIGYQIVGRAGPGPSAQRDQRRHGKWRARPARLRTERPPQYSRRLPGICSHSYHCLVHR